MSRHGNNIIIATDNTNRSTTNNSSIIGGSNTRVTNSNSVVIGSSTITTILNPSNPKVFIKDNPLTIKQNITISSPGTISANDLNLGFITITGSGAYTLDTTTNILNAILDSSATAFTDNRPEIQVTFYNNSGGSITIAIGSGQSLTNGSSPITIVNGESRTWSFWFTSNSTMLIEDMKLGSFSEPFYTKDNKRAIISGIYNSISFTETPYLFSTSRGSATIGGSTNSGVISGNGTVIMGGNNNYVQSENTASGTCMIGGINLNTILSASGSVVIGGSDNIENIYSGGVSIGGNLNNAQINNYGVRIGGGLVNANINNASISIGSYRTNVNIRGNGSFLLGSDTTTNIIGDFSFGSGIIGGNLSYTKIGSLSGDSFITPAIGSILIGGNNNQNRIYGDGSVSIGGASKSINMLGLGNISISSSGSVGISSIHSNLVMIGGQNTKLQGSNSICIGPSTLTTTLEPSNPKLFLKDNPITIKTNAIYTSPTTITATDIAAGIIQFTNTSGAYTLPTTSDILLALLDVNSSVFNGNERPEFQVRFYNNSSGSITIATNTGQTLTNGSSPITIINGESRTWSFWFTSNSTMLIEDMKSGTFSFTEPLYTKDTQRAIISGYGNSIIFNAGENGMASIGGAYNTDTLNGTGMVAMGGMFNNTNSAGAGYGSCVVGGTNLTTYFGQWGGVAVGGGTNSDNLSFGSVAVSGIDNTIGVNAYGARIGGELISGNIGRGSVSVGSYSSNFYMNQNSGRGSVGLGSHKSNITMLGRGSFLLGSNTITTIIDTSSNGSGVIGGNLSNLRIGSSITTSLGSVLIGGNNNQNKMYGSGSISIGSNSSTSIMIGDGLVNIGGSTITTNMTGLGHVGLASSGTIGISSTHSNLVMIGGQNTRLQGSNSICIGPSTLTTTLEPSTPKLFLKDNPITIKNNVVYTSPTTITAADIASGIIQFTTASGAYTLPTTSDILLALLDSNSNAFVGNIRPEFQVRFYNNSGGSITIATNTGQTLTNGSSPITIINGESRTWSFWFTSNSTMLIEDMKSGTFSFNEPLYTKDTQRAIISGYGNSFTFSGTKYGMATIGGAYNNAALNSTGMVSVGGAYNTFTSGGSAYGSSIIGGVNLNVNLSTRGSVAIAGGNNDDVISAGGISISGFNNNATIRSYGSRVGGELISGQIGRASATVGSYSSVCYIGTDSGYGNGRGSVILGSNTSNITMLARGSFLLGSNTTTTVINSGSYGSGAIGGNINNIKIGSSTTPSLGSISIGGNNKQNKVYGSGLVNIGGSTITTNMTGLGHVGLASSGTIGISSTHSNLVMVGGQNTTLQGSNSICIGPSTLTTTLEPSTPKLFLKDNPVTIKTNIIYTSPTTITATDIASGIIQFTTVSGSYTLPTTANILLALLDLNSNAFIGNVRPEFQVRFYNNSGGTISIVLGTGQTLTNGTSPISIANGESRTWSFWFTSNSTMLIEDMKSGGFSEPFYTSNLRGIFSGITNSITNINPNSGGGLLGGITNTISISPFTGSFVISGITNTVTMTASGAVNVGGSSKLIQMTGLGHVGVASTGTIGITATHANLVMIGGQNTRLQGSNSVCIGPSTLTTTLEPSNPKLFLKDNPITIKTNATYTTPTTITATDIASGIIQFEGAPAVGAYTLPTTANILLALLDANSTAFIGNIRPEFQVRFYNNSGGVVTIATNTGQTLTNGTSPITMNIAESRTWSFWFTSNSTILIEDMKSGNFNEPFYTSGIRGIFSGITNSIVNINRNSGGGTLGGVTNTVSMNAFTGSFVISGITNTITMPASGAVNIGGSGENITINGNGGVAISSSGTVGITSANTGLVMIGGANNTIRNTNAIMIGPSTITTTFAPSVGKLYLKDNPVRLMEEISFTATGTITAAQLTSGYLRFNPSTTNITMTLPTALSLYSYILDGTTTAFIGRPRPAFDAFLYNTHATTSVTILAGTGFTLPNTGSGVIPGTAAVGTMRQLTCIFTSPSTAMAYIR